MTIQKIQSVYMVIDDMEAMQSFYSEVLGFEPKFRDGDRWTQFAIGGSNFALASSEEAAPCATGPVVVFETTDPDHVRARVERAGGSWVAARDMGTHGQVLTFTDPEGRPFQVFSKTASTTPSSGS